MNHHGSCHCGAIAFEADGEIQQVIECNCSICSKRGSLLWFVPRDRFRLTTPESACAVYTFNTHKIRHHFCPSCGCAPFAYGIDPQGNAIAAINVRCLDDVDPAALNKTPFDGRSL
jgi:hypothetical protein